MRQKGFKHTEQTKEKIRKANKGRIFTEEWKNKISLANKGKESPLKGRVFVNKEEQRIKKLKYRREWRRKNRERILKIERIKRERNRDRYNEMARNYYKKNREKELDRIRMKKYGITGDEFRIKVKKQNSICPICKRKIKTNLTVDHDHNTGKIRGLICSDCNLAIGNAGESPKRLKSMAKYLENYYGT